MWSFTNKIRSRIVGKKSPVILASVFLLGAGGLIAHGGECQSDCAAVSDIRGPGRSFCHFESGRADRHDDESFLSGLREQRTPLCHLSSAQRRLVGHTAACSSALRGLEWDGSYFPTGGRR